MALKKVTINSVTYETNEINIPLADNPSVKAKFMETSDGNLVAAKIAKGTSGYSGGVKVSGTAEEIGTIAETLDTNNPSYVVPSGFVEGGEVKIITETKTATPTKSAQKISATSGKVLSEVTVNKIPDEFQDVTDVTATATDVANGKVIVGADGSKITGTHTDPMFALANGVLSIE
jgi:hypothetical protein